MQTRYRTVSIRTLTIFSAVLILTSCLFDPTESDVIYSRSSNLHVYEPGNILVYDVSGSRVNLVENVNGEAYVVETNIFGKITNCDNTDSTVGGPCSATTKFTGKLTREWTTEIDLPAPLNLEGPIRALEEKWTLSLDKDGEYTNTRYISQVKTGLKQGELSVHAYSTQTPGVYYWLSETRTVDMQNSNTFVQTPEAAIIMEPSPLEDILGNSYFNDYDILEGCGGQSNCTPIAGITRNSTYQYSSESIATPYGKLETYYIDKTVNAIRPMDASAAINLGFDFETNCHTEAGAAVTDSSYQVVSAAYSGYEYVFPDVGPLKLYVACHYSYVVPFIIGGAVRLNGTNSSDAETAKEALTYTWTMTTQPAGSKAILNADDTWAPTFTADVEGLYELSLMVTDGESNSSQDKVSINATRPPKVDSEGNLENRPPIANAGLNQNVAADQLVSLYAGNSTDADLDIPTYQWSVVGNTTVLNNSTAVSPTFMATSGTYEFQLVVNDGVLDSIPDTVFVTVVSGTGSQPPLAQAGTNQNIVFGVRDDVPVSTNIQYDALISQDTNIDVPTK